MIEGQAKGFWFFEASFPVKLVDEDKKNLAQGIATAQSDWMTTDFVPFRAELKFDSAKQKAGFLILQKDNPEDALSHRNDQAQKRIVPGNDAFLLGFG